MAGPKAGCPIPGLRSGTALFKEDFYLPNLQLQHRHELRQQLPQRDGLLEASFASRSIEGGGQVRCECRLPRRVIVWTLSRRPEEVASLPSFNRNSS